MASARRDRRLTWDGCINVRDLGGLPTVDGRVTRFGGIVRADHPARLTAAGWAALTAYGIRTIVSLETAGIVDDAQDAAPRPAELARVRVEIEDMADADFVDQWVRTNLWCTPLYYRDALRRWPERHAAAVTAVARARPGGVLFHCARGHDRTGIIALLLLALAGVTPKAIAADYELSRDPERETLLRQRGTSTRQVILETLAAFDAASYLRAAGMRARDLAAVRTRLLKEGK